MHATQSRFCRAGGPAAVAILILAGCGPGTPDPPQVAFWNDVRALCGQAFEGRAVEWTAVDSAAASQPLVLDVWQCYRDEIRLAFHIGEDASRVWRLTRDVNGLHLTHEVHTKDGAESDVSGYGGVTSGDGTATRQEFRPDYETNARLPAAAGSIWTLEVVPHERMTYEFRSEREDVTFRVDFDLTSHTARRPPPPWGFTRQSRPAS
jgi:hypothetical protein